VDAVLGTFNGWVDDFDRFEPLQEVFADLSGINRDAWVVWSSVTRGALGTARELAERGTLSPVNLQIYLGHSAVSWGVLPEGDLAGRASAAACATPFNGGCYAFAAAALATAARWPELAAAVRSVRQAAQEAAAAGDSTAARARLAAADVMEGVGEHARGNRAQARALLVPHRERAGLVGNVARQTLARIDLAEQRWEQAARQVQGEVHSYARASAFYIQAQAYEGRGDTARAREAWRHFVATTRTGDGDLPQIRTARAALARLGG
jgi:hypothetical protein